MKMKNLMKTHDKYPSEVGTLIYYFAILNTDIRFLQDVPAIKKKVEMQLVPVATFAARKVVTAFQKYIVLWSIAMLGLSFPKMQTIKTYKEMLMAVINAKQLMPGHPD